MLPKEIQLEVNKGAMLPLMEEFYTIQGEGSHTGRAAAGMPRFILQRK